MLLLVKFGKYPIGKVIVGVRLLTNAKTKTRKTFTVELIDNILKSVMTARTSFLTNTEFTGLLGNVI